MKPSSGNEGVHSPEEMYDSDGTTESETSSEDESGDDDANEVPVPEGTLEFMTKDFIAIAPDDADASGIENLGKQLFKFFDVDLKELASLLVGQNYVTTVLKEEEEDGPPPEDEPQSNDGSTVYGVYSMINLNKNKDNPFVKQVVALILKYGRKCEEGAIFNELLNAESTKNPNTTGLLIKERMVNIPGVAAAPFLKQLFNDLEDATKNNMPYDFSHFIHIAKMIRVKNQQDYFVDQEDEILHEHNTRYFNIKYPSTVDTKIVFQNASGHTIRGKIFRRVYVLTKNQMSDVMKDILDIGTVKSKMMEAASSGLKI